MAAGGPALASINPNVHQGYFAESFVASIAAAAGLDIQLPRLGHGIDLGVFRPGPNGTSGSRQMNLQVKSWSTGTLNADGHFHYPLEVPAFNRSTISPAVVTTSGTTSSCAWFQPTPLATRTLSTSGFG